MIQPLSVCIAICIVALCNGQGTSYFMSRGGGRGYDGGRGGSFMEGGYDSSYMGRGMGSSYMDRGMGPSYMDRGMGPSFMRGESSYMGSGGDSYMGRDFGGDRRGSRFDTYRGDGGSGYRDGFDRSRSSGRSGRRTSGGGDGIPPEGHIGGRGGQNGFPVQGGYCADSGSGPCSDGGLSAGVGNGYGTGTKAAMNRRLMTGENESIRYYEPMSGGPATMGGGMGGPGLVGGMSGPGMFGMGGSMGGGYGPPGGGFMGGPGMPYF